MIRIENGRSHLEVTFFDGVYEVVRCFYPVRKSKLFRVLDTYGGETYVVTRRCNGGVLYFFDLGMALNLLHETGNAETNDSLWLINQNF